MRSATPWLAAIAAATFIPAGCYGQTVDEGNREKTSAADANAARGDADAAKVAEIIVAKTNKFRRDEGRAEVKVNAKLAETAQYFAGFMARTGKYGHTADDSRPADRAVKHGYDYCIILENIAYQFRSTGFTTEELAAGFVGGWQKSPGHRKNMLDPDVTDTGVAVAASPDTGYWYAVQMFGRPKSLSIEFSVVNRSGADVQYKVGDESFTLPANYTRTHQRCRPSELTFRPPDAKPDAEPQTAKPANGNTFAIVREGDQIRLRKD